MYKHRPLQLPRSTRIIYLDPLTQNAHSVSCKLIEVSLESNATYEALSYTWDAQTLDVPIKCDGEEMLITKNCHAALLRLRRPRISRALWIDAICIDQTPEAEEERSKQVPLMGEVYSKAAEVIIWIGESTPVSDLAMKFLREFAEMDQEKHFRDYKYKRLMRKLYRADEAAEAAGTAKLGIFEAVVDRSWFQRIWTVQEVALARNKIVWCGSQTISWHMLVTGLENATTRRNKGRPWDNTEGAFATEIACTAFFENIIWRRRYRDKIGQPQPRPPTLSVVLFEAQRQRTTNPKDVIYGIYSLLAECEIILPTPDYSKSVEQIYTETAKAAILQENTLNIFYQACRQEKLKDLPSWVPDFSADYGYYPHWKPHMFFSSKKSKSKFEFLDSDRLAVQGKFLGEITARAHSVMGWNEEEGFDYTANMTEESGFITCFEPYVKAYRSWCELAETLKTYPTGDPVSLVLACTLVHDEPFRKEPGEDKWESKSFSAGFTNWFTNVAAGISDEAVTLDFVAGVAENKFLPNKGVLDKFFNAEDKKNMDAIKKNLVYQIIRILYAHEETRTYDYIVQTRLRTSRLVVTSDGYLGTAPPMTKVGDRIFLVAGLSLPMIVRQEDGISKLIGASYIHGIMDGEKWPADEKDLDWVTLS